VSHFVRRAGSALPLETENLANHLRIFSCWGSFRRAYLEFSREGPRGWTHRGLFFLLAVPQSPPSNAVCT